MERSRASGRVRLVDIAREAGVSVAVVSQVLTGASGTIGVSAVKAALVKEVAQRLHYHPNVMARSLVGGRSKIIGVHIDSRAPETDWSILAALEEQLGRLGYRVMVAESHNDVEGISEACVSFREYGVDGVVMISHAYKALFDELDQNSSRFQDAVFVNRPLIDGTWYVEIDYRKGMELAVRHLLAVGKHRVGLLLFHRESTTVEARRQAFGDVVRMVGEPLSCGKVVDCSIQELERDPSAFYEACIRSHGFDGVIVQDDLRALGVLAVLQGQGLRVPEDVAVVGWNNCDYSRYAYPSLTTLDIQPRKIAWAAFELLDARMQGKSPKFLQRFVAPELVIRQSTVKNVQM